MLYLPIGAQYHGVSFRRWVLDYRTIGRVESIH